jgi:hypothetical protein
VFAIFTALIRRNSDNFGNDCDVLERKIGGELGIIEVNWVFYYLKNKNNRCTCDHALLFETIQYEVVLILKHAFQTFMKGSRRRGCSNLTLCIVRFVFKLQTRMLLLSLSPNVRSPSIYTNTQSRS